MFPLSRRLGLPGIGWVPKCSRNQSCIVGVLALVVPCHRAWHGRSALAKAEFVQGNEENSQSWVEHQREGLLGRPAEEQGLFQSLLHRSPCTAEPNLSLQGSQLKNSPDLRESLLVRQFLLAVEAQSTRQPLSPLPQLLPLPPQHSAAVWGGWGHLLPSSQGMPSSGSRCAAHA